MLLYYITISIDDEFGIIQNNWSNSQSKNVLPGILKYNTTIFNSSHHGSLASLEGIIDVNLIKDKNFFKPLYAILSQDIKLNDMTQNDFEKIMSKFGDYEKGLIET